MANIEETIRGCENLLCERKYLVHGKSPLRLLVDNALKQLNNYSNLERRAEFRETINRAIEKGKENGDWYATYDKKTGRLIYQNDRRYKT